MKSPFITPLRLQVPTLRWRSLPEAIEYINNQVNNGWLIRSLHNIAGNGLIAVSLVQIIVMFVGREMLGGWIVGWISGIFLTLTAIGLGWTAMNLE